jgi:glutamyl endopeptidase
MSADTGVESIISADIRVKVSPTTALPARTVDLVTFDGGCCPGWLFGTHIAATAAHCVHSSGSGGAWRTNVRVYSGYSGISTPYGSCTAKRLHAV